MNIVLTLPGSLADPNSGAPRTALELARHYRALGHEVLIVSFDDIPGRLGARAHLALFPFFLAHHLRRLARARPFDVVDGSAGDLWAFAATTPTAARPLIVYRSHGSPLIYYEERAQEERLGRLKVSWRDHLYFGRIKTLEQRLSLTRSDLAIFLSRKEAASAAAKLGAQPRRSHVVPLGIAGSFLGRPIEPTPEAAGAPVRIAVVGHYIPRKGVHYAIEALRAVLAAHPTASVSFLGTGVPAEQVLRDLDPAWHARVAVVPYYANEALPELLRGHHIKLFPTLAEGFGKALVEAMACGLAAVGTDAEGVLDILEDGRAGLVVPRRDPSALAAALTRLIEDRALLDRMRRIAHARAQAFSWERSASRRLELYHQALRERPCAAGTPAGRGAATPWPGKI